MLVTHNETNVMTTMVVRSFFEHMNETQRIEFLNSTLAPAVRHYAELFDTVAKFLETAENSKTISDDMRQIGGYATLFTEQYLKSGPPEKKQ